MIKFFRKIRYNLMEQNKTSKYFKYAIGEIVLVVIGILIALSINNWNEKRKEALQEISILKNLQTDLKTDLEGISYQIVLKEGMIKDYKNCLEILSEKKEGTKEEITKKFQLHEKDTGSADVQIAILTERIAELTEHLKRAPKDHNSRLSLLKLVGQRRRLLDYLNSTDTSRYQALITKLKLRR